MAYAFVKMKNEDVEVAKRFKQVPVGFSWTFFIFEGLVALFRRDIITFIFVTVGFFVIDVLLVEVYFMLVENIPAIAEVNSSLLESLKSFNVENNVAPDVSAKELLEAIISNSIYVILAFIGAIFYNKYDFKRLLKQGYTPYEVVSKKGEALGFDMNDSNLSVEKE